MPGKRKIIVSVAISADGFIARRDGAVDWLDRPQPKGNNGMGAFYRSIDTILWGRKTCDMALAFQAKGIVGSAFDTSVKNYVFTHTQAPSAPPSGVEFVNEPVKAFATRLRAKKGKDIWIMGGAGLIASFLDEGEIDEFILSVVPTLIGEGIPLIVPRHRTVPLKLISSTKFTDGLVKLHYSGRQTACTGQSYFSRRTRTSFLNWAVDSRVSLQDARQKDTRRTRKRKSAYHRHIWRSSDAA